MCWNGMKKSQRALTSMPTKFVNGMHVWNLISGRVSLPGSQLPLQSSDWYDPIQPLQPFPFLLSRTLVVILRVLPVLGRNEALALGTVIGRIAKSMLMIND